MAVTGWATKNGFEPDANESTRLHISSLCHVPPAAPLLVNGLAISNCKTVEVLGITLDRHLSFRNHYGKVENQCKTRLDLFNEVSGK